MIQVYADEALVYDSRLPEYDLLGLTATKGVNKSGTAEIYMPPNHPAYNRFISYRTVVTIYRDGQLLFRGRAIYPSDDFYNRRTITCEGERGFLRDGVMRPYLYQDAPSVIFEDIIGLYNAQVEPFKQFVVGTVDVTDPNNYIRLESSKAEQIADTIDKLVERVGGYIIFTTNSDGARVINWFKDLGYRSNQTIAFGENLLDFARTDAETDLATVVIPYGAVDETTGERVTITSVTEYGEDYVQDYAAVALRGVVSVPVYWDDVTDPHNLLAKAQQWLEGHKNIITSLKLSAVDLSALDKNIDSFDVGDLVTVLSRPHKVDTQFTLTDRTYDLLHPENDEVTLGKEQSSLTGSDAAGDKNNQNELYRVENNVRKDFQLNLQQAIETTQLTLTSLIEQTSEAIKLEVSEQYVTADTVTQEITSRMTQLSDSFTFEFERLQQVIDENGEAIAGRFDILESWVKIADGRLILGESGNEITLELENDVLYFSDGGARVAYMTNKKLVITDAHFLNSIQIGNFKLVPRRTGNLSLVKVG